MDGAGVITPLAQGWGTDKGAVLAPGSNFPQPELVPVDLGSKQAVIRAEPERMNPAHGAEQLLAGARVPQPQRAVPARAGQQVPSVVEGHPDPVAAMAFQHQGLLAAGH